MQDTRFYVIQDAYPVKTQPSWSGSIRGTQGRLRNIPCIPQFCQKKGNISRTFEETPRNVQGWLAIPNGMAT
ncbi:hypothetical protein SUGI_0407200 [Cryptomeria japonica]|nr:hypothetical protein SUGI_0407200 [Cryptomeria japonica]